MTVITLLRSLSTSLHLRPQPSSTFRILHSSPSEESPRPRRPQASTFSLFRILLRSTREVPSKATLAAHVKCPQGNARCPCPREVRLSASQSFRPQTQPHPNRQLAPSTFIDLHHPSPSTYIHQPSIIHHPSIENSWCIFTTCASSTLTILRGLQVKSPERNATKRKALPTNATTSRHHSSFIRLPSTVIISTLGTS